MKLSIVVVNWNSGDLLHGCAQSVHAALAGFAGGWELLVVDNASSDGSLQRARLAGSVRVLRNDSNLGFGAACNAAARLAQGETLLMLNPDSQLRPGSVERALHELDRTDMRVGICGVGLLDAQGRLARSCHRFPSFLTLCCQATGLKALRLRWTNTPMLEWDHRHDRTVDHVIGAFYAVRRETFQTLGGFDERFFLYLEDLDFSLRARRAGWLTRFVATPCSVHLGGGTSEQVKAGRLFYATRSRMLYAFKHLPRWQAWLHAAATLTVEPFARSVHCVVRGAWSELPFTWQAFVMLVRDLPAVGRQVAASGQ